MIAAPEIDEAALPAAMRRGLQVVRERVLPGARVVALDNNFVVMAVGTMTKASTRLAEPTTDDAELPEGYVEEQAALYARVSRNFPNAESYGVVTAPFLTRKDSRPVEWQHRNNANAAAVAAVLGRSDVGFWSWNWQGGPSRVPEDLVAVVEWARRCIREGAR